MNSKLVLTASTLAMCLGCSGSSTSTDLSKVQMVPLPASAPADGMTPVTLTLFAVGSDGSTKFNGTVYLNSRSNIRFGVGNSIGSDTLTMKDGSASDTVVCDPTQNCVGSVTIRAQLASPGASGSTTTVVVFTLGDGGTGSGTTGGTNGGSGSTGGTGGTGGTGSPDGGDAGPPPPPGQLLNDAGAAPFMGIDYQSSVSNNGITNTFHFRVMDVSGSIPIVDAGVIFTYLVADPRIAFLRDLGPDAGIDAGELKFSNSNGDVSVVAQSGQITGQITVTAATNGLTSTESSQVRGTQPSAGHSTLVCAPKNLPVFTGGNLPCESTSPVTLTTTCALSLADRFGNVVTDPAAYSTVTFFSEAGNFAPVDPFTIQGVVTDKLQTYGAVPIDVDPDPTSSEPSHLDLCSQDGLRTYNPRDGVVTVIATFTGEEAFIPTQGTNIYTPGDTFTDLPQAFVDANDDSVWDAGEKCAGVSSGGACLGPNGVWDANTTIYAETRIVYTGDPASTDGGSTVQFVPPTFAVGLNSSQTNAVLWADSNLNLPASAAAYNVVIGSGPSAAQLAWPAPGHAANSPDSYGFIYTPLTDCSAGVVPSDAGPVASQICHQRTAITNYSGGFTGYYKLSDSNMMPGMGGGVTLNASVVIGADQFNETASGSIQ